MMQYKTPSSPFLFGLSGEAVQSLGLHIAVSVRMPALHDLVPESVYPVLQTGVHEDPCARVEVQSFRAPLAMAAAASHGLRLHTAVSVSVPSVHDLVPDRA